MGKGVRENTLFFILFQRPTHFYLKKSDSTERTEKEMRRRTVYWQPDIKIKKGKADIIFTAPPQAPPLLMVIQGISANGKLITANKIL
jgi:hypothetical protein